MTKEQAHSKKKCEFKLKEIRQTLASINDVDEISILQAHYAFDVAFLLEEIELLEAMYESVIDEISEQF